MMTDAENPPKLARRRLNRRSSLKSGRTIVARREPLEKAADRAAAHDKIRKKQLFRTVVTGGGFVLIFAILIFFSFGLAHGNNESNPTNEAVTYKPTIEIIDEDAVSGELVSSRMKDYVGQAEFDFRALGLVPTKAVVPKGSIREIDFYLEGYPGFIKTTLDRGTGVTTEDTKRMLNYLESKGITEFEYIDVRLEGKAYWK